MHVDRKLIFDAAKARGATFTTRAHVALMDAAIDAAIAPDQPVAAPVGLPTRMKPDHRRISAKGRALIHSFEQCRLTTYPDPGSKDGKPVTGGWGSTVDENGKPFRLGFTASKVYWDALFDRQIVKYERAVHELLGDTPTTQNAFDAMVCLCYNIGIGSKNPALKGGFTRSSVLRFHKASDHKNAARAFLMWNKNDSKVMRGLTRRRLAEADLYDDPA